MPRALVANVNQCRHRTLAVGGSLPLQGQTPRSALTLHKFHASRILDMPLLNLIITLIVVGVLLWLVNTYIPMDRKIKSILNAVVVIAVILWLLSVFGILGDISGIRVGS